MDAAEIVIFAKNHSGYGIKPKWIAAAIPSDREKVGNGVSAISHLAMRGR